MSLQLDIQCATSEPVPEENAIRRWILATVATQAREEALEICLRLVDTDEMTALNKSYRGKDAPTNVLSFPASLPAGVTHPLLGDIVICAGVVAMEAGAQNKTLDAHWAHMLVHGTLHLLGYDHIEETEAKTMETLESTILQELNYSCPYSSLDSSPDSSPDNETKAQERLS